MKKSLGLFWMILMALFAFTACNGNTSVPNGVGGNGTDNNGTTSPPAATASHFLVVYFSCTDTTERIAKFIQAESNGTLYEIVPEIPYSADDLKYYTNGRADREQADPSARPAINGKVADMEKYDVVFLGYPIWHGQAPRIISTFLESYDFSGKTIVPFCTSHSSGIGSSDTNLHALAPDAEWIAGRRFSLSTPQKDIADWIESLASNPLPT